MFRAYSFLPGTVMEEIMEQIIHMKVQGVEADYILVSRPYFKHYAGSGLYNNLVFQGPDKELKIKIIYSPGIVEVVPTRETADAWELHRRKDEYIPDSGEFSGYG